MTEEERTWLRHQFAEIDKYQAETRKLEIEGRCCDRWLVPVGLITGATLFAAGAAFVKLVL